MMTNGILGVQKTRRFKRQFQQDHFGLDFTARVETGEPYLVFKDRVNNLRPEQQKLAGLEIKTSNLCSEITLPTGTDHHGKRTAVCCLSSVNIEKFYEWENDKNFIPDIMRFLDNVIQDFIDNALDTMETAAYSAMRDQLVLEPWVYIHFFKQIIFHGRE